MTEESLFEKKEELSFCENSQEWTDINGDIFFRRRSAKYLIDKRKLCIFAISKPSWIQNKSFTFHVEISYMNFLLSKKKYHDFKIDNILKLNGYEDNSLSVEINLDDLTQRKDFDEKILKIIFFISLFDKTNPTHYMNSKIITAEVGYQRKANFIKNNVVICTEPLYLENKDFKDIEYWVELNKMIGYEKIVIFNNTIPNNGLYNNFFLKHRDFIDVFQFNCLPNLVFPGEKYLKKYVDFLTGEWKSNMETILFLGFDSIANNECLYRYSKSIKYALVQDNDEAFIPPQLDHFETEKKTYDLLKKEVYLMDEFKEKYFNENLCQKQSLDFRVGKIINEFKIPDDFSIHFPQVMFINAELTFLIFDEIGRLDPNLRESFKNYPIKVKVFQDYTDQSNKYYRSKIYANNFTLVINNFTEYVYAMNLFNSFKHVVEPFMMENKEKLGNISDLFKRFYYFRQPFKPHSYVGKTMVSENIETFASPHFPYKSPSFVDNDYYLSHFRVIYELEKIEGSITHFHFDYSYFMCYFRPLFSLLS